jgi:transcription elongation factor Elf1
MSKLLKDTHVYIPCPACGKVEGVKLKWAQRHKSLKCGKCREKLDLRANPARSLIARTGEALVSFEAVLDALYAEAKKTAKALRPRKDKKAKQGKKKGGKQAKSKKKPVKRAVTALPPESSSDPV